MVIQALERVIRTAPARIVMLTSNDPMADGEGVESQALQWGSKIPNLDLSVVREDVPLGTAGAVRNGLEETSPPSGSTVLVVPSDVILPWQSFSGVVSHHRNADSAATWALTSNPGPEAQNTHRIITEIESGKIVRSLENKPDEDPTTYYEQGKYVGLTSVGVIAVNSSAYAEFYDEKYGLEHGTRAIDVYREFIPTMIDSGIAVHSFDVGVPAQDLGTPERLFQFGRMQEVNH